MSIQDLIMDACAELTRSTGLIGEKIVRIHPATHARLMDELGAVLHVSVANQIPSEIAMQTPYGQAKLDITAHQPVNRIDVVPGGSVPLHRRVAGSVIRDVPMAGCACAAWPDRKIGMPHADSCPHNPTAEHRVATPDYASLEDPRELSNDDYAEWIRRRRDQK